MRIGFIQVHQKSNSFSRYPTQFNDFEAAGILHGEQVIDQFLETNTLAGHLCQMRDTNDFQLVPLLTMSAPTAGPLLLDTLEQILKQVDGLSESVSPLDGVIVELSGATATLDGRSADLEILSRIRSLSDSVKLVAVFDHQANLPEQITDQFDTAIARKPLSPCSENELAQRAVAVLQSVIEDPNSTNTTLKTIPMLIPVPAQRSDLTPYPEIQHQLERLQQGNQLADLSFVSGYPFADVPFAGAAVLATGSAEAANSAAESLASEVWDQRRSIFVEGSNIEEAVHHAMASREQPVLIADLGDNPDDGAPGDGTTVLWALLDLGVRSATVAPICDEQAVEACVRAGVDAKVAIPVGGRKDTRHGYPIDIEGNVVAIFDGPISLTGPVRTGTQLDTGRIVVLNIDARHDGHVELVLTEKPVQISDLAFFDHIEIDISERTIVSIKSSGEYSPAFLPVASTTFEVITPGITTPDPAFFAYQNVRRPIFPLDEIPD